MSSAIPPQLEGSHAPNAIELLWERHRRTVYTLIAALACALLLNYGVKYYYQAQVNREWSAFAAAAGLANGYDNKDLAGVQGQEKFGKAATKMPTDLLRQVAKMSDAQLEGALETASEAQAPYLLWLLAVRAIQSKEWDKAEAALARLEREHPKHTLCVVTDHPVQVRSEVKKDPAQKPAAPEKRPELAPPVKGSMVGLLRAQIAESKGFQLPSHFQKPAIPENAPKVKVKLSGNWGEFTIALLREKAPSHVDKFLELVDSKFFEGIKVDEIHRHGTKFQFYAPEFHFGFAKTKESDDRTQWQDPNPSSHQVAFEANDLSHFPGAVAARAEGDKSSPDRIWISAEDNARFDGSRVIFGYVVEGLDVLRNVTEAPLSVQQEEEQGLGKPTDNIVIESVTRL